MKSLSYAVTGPPVTVSLAGDPASPQAAGTPITFTATGGGGTGNLQYKFLAKGPGTGNLWQIVKDWGTNTWLWTPIAADKGVTNIVVYAQSVGAPVGVEASATKTYTIK